MKKHYSKNINIQKKERKKQYYYKIHRLSKDNENLNKNETRNKISETRVN